MPQVDKDGIGEKDPDMEQLVGSKDDSAEGLDVGSEGEGWRSPCLSCPGPSWGQRADLCVTVAKGTFFA